MTCLSILVTVGELANVHDAFGVKLQDGIQFSNNGQVMVEM